MEENKKRHQILRDNHQERSKYISYLTLSSVCVCHQKVLADNTPQYLSQMKSDIHETFSVLQDWSPELFINVHESACVGMHAQHVELCTQHW